MNVAVELEAPRPQRASGTARIRFATRPDGRTALDDLFQRAPCRALFPCTEPDDLTQVVLLTTTGGLTGGDRLRVDLELDEGARAIASTQAAEKIYRGLPAEEPVSIQTALRLAPGAWGEWLPQETILFANARLRRRLEAEVAPSARLLAVESFVFGRIARGERFDHGLLQDTWRIRRDGRLLWADGIHLSGDIAAVRAAPFGFGTAVASATIVYVAAEANQYIDEVRRVLKSHGEIGTATAFDGLLVVRLVADDVISLRTAVMAIAGGIRHWAAGLPERLPKVWYC